uniref:Protein kinase domain-containing protein n=1 Tax=Ganoderma boninense TaxID=34458 RepID=A0A5K1JSP4_9APHY|nr:Protein kinase domain-containing protein [Ganoderma boninense]
MEPSLQDQLRRLLRATHPPRGTTPGVQDDSESNLTLPIVVVSRPPGSRAADSWAIAVVTDKRSHQCRVFHVSHAYDRHGMRAPGWTVFAENEVLDRRSDYAGGVCIGRVDRADLARLEQALCGSRFPPPMWERWSAETWTVTAIRHLEAQGFTIVTYGLDNDHLSVRLTIDAYCARRLTEEQNSAPIFVPLSLSGAERRPR